MYGITGEAQVELWTYWLSAIHSLLIFLSSHVGLGTGLAIVTLTLLLRTAILPLSWSVAYRSTIRQKRMLRLQPELARLKAECGNQPQVYAQRMMALYQRHGISVMDWRSVLGSLLQMPLFLGMYQTFAPVAMAPASFGSRLCLARISGLHCSPGLRRCWSWQRILICLSKCG
jgi:YidC/Oxa1 family membrane protein insertase